MKYLKLYEDISISEREEIKKDIKDALIELEDIGFIVKISIDECVCIEIYKYHLAYFYMSDNITNIIKTAIDYLTFEHKITFEYIKLKFNYIESITYDKITDIYNDKLIRKIDITFIDNVINAYIKNN